MTSTGKELREVLERAAELEQAAPLGPADVDVLFQAADEVGIPRAAVERALREIHTTLPAPPTVGQLVFARSADDLYYAAEVTEAHDGRFKVRFLRGGENTLHSDEMRPCSLLPGQRVRVKWPGWGNWTCTVLSYEADRRMVTVSDGWAETRIFDVGDVWLDPRKTEMRPRKGRLRTAILGAAAAGAAIGSIITALLMG